LRGAVHGGAKPAEIPVEQPTKFDFVINLTTAKALGLTIPESFLLRADEVSSESPRFHHACWRRSRVAARSAQQPAMPVVGVMNSGSPETMSHRLSNHARQSQT